MCSLIMPQIFLHYMHEVETSNQFYLRRRKSIMIKEASQHQTQYWEGRRHRRHRRRRRKYPQCLRFFWPKAPDTDRWTSRTYLQGCAIHSIFKYVRVCIDQWDGLTQVVTYLPAAMDSPKETEMAAEITVPRGLKMETITGPLFFIAHALKLTHTPLMPPAYFHIQIHTKH